MAYNGTNSLMNTQSNVHEKGLYARGGGGGTSLFGEQSKVFGIFSQKRGIQSH